MQSKQDPHALFDFGTELRRIALFLHEVPQRKDEIARDVHGRCVAGAADEVQEVLRHAVSAMGKRKIRRRMFAKTTGVDHADHRKVVEIQTHGLEEIEGLGVDHVGLGVPEHRDGQVFLVRFEVRKDDVTSGGGGFLVDAIFQDACGPGAELRKRRGALEVGGEMALKRKTFLVHLEAAVVLRRAAGVRLLNARQETFHALTRLQYVVAQMQLRLCVALFFEAVDDDVPD